MASKFPPLQTIFFSIKDIISKPWSQYFTILSQDTDLNTTHRTSDGSDHTFIDQDVTTTSCPTFVCVTLSETTTPTAVGDKGKVYTKSNNKLYFQDGAGAEHLLVYADLNITHVTSAYTVVQLDDIVSCGAGNETFSVDLPLVSALIDRKKYYIKNVGSGTITVDADNTGGTTIDGSTTFPLALNESVTVVRDGSIYIAI